MKDQALLKASREHYVEVGLPRSESKAFQKRYRFVAWGTEVCSASARTGVPNAKLAVIAGLVVGAMRLPLFSKRALQQLLGQFPHPFMHQKELSSVFGRSYRYVHGLDEDRLYRLPALVKEEFVIAGLLLGVASTNIRWPLSTRKIVQ